MKLSLPCVALAALSLAACNQSKPIELKNGAEILETGRAQTECVKETLKESGVTAFTRVTWNIAMNGKTPDWTQTGFQAYVDGQEEAVVTALPNDSTTMASPTYQAAADINDMTVPAFTVAVMQCRNVPAQQLTSAAGFDVKNVFVPEGQATFRRVVVRPTGLR